MVNKTQRKYIWLSVIVILLVLIIDQTSKFLVKTNMFLGESIEVFSWFKILFIENNGMAFGMELGSKLFLTIFRIVAITLIGFYIFKLIKNSN
ncbi:MAG: signal peptidase II, partial [Coprobacter sp.]|nr:signal peptidase II [Coprobacter sp.]